MRAAVISLRKSAGALNRLCIAKQVTVEHPPAFRIEPLGYVIFVHGYNNSQEEARVSYARFRWWLQKLGNRPRVLELHWPGDSLKGLGWASYWRQTRTAQECGRLLGQWVENAPARTRFVLVGHSMGCRVVLEALRQMNMISRRRHVSGVCLMAAAVPVRMVRRGTLGPVPNDRTDWRILYSPGDMVLRVAFPFGQAAAWDSIFTHAVGLFGDPREKWEAAGGRCCEMFESVHGKTPNYGHGWYWRSASREKKIRVHPGSRSLPGIKSMEPTHGASAKAVTELLGRVIARVQEARLNPVERAIAPQREFWSRDIAQQL